MKNDIAIVIFTKNPIIGQVKTRLNPKLGQENAHKLYCELLKHSIGVALDVRDVDKYIYTTPSLDHWFFKDYQENHSITVNLQEGEDLGLRMHSAFVDILSKYKACVLLGGDCPQISTSILNDAIRALKSTDVVLGPTNDGGYYLIGLKTPNINLFRNMQWSDIEVFNNTTKRIKKDNLNYTKIEELIDIDEYTDLQALSHIDWLNQYIN